MTIRNASTGALCRTRLEPTSKYAQPDRTEAPHLSAVEPNDFFTSSTRMWSSLGMFGGGEASIREASVPRAREAGWQNLPESDG